MTRRPSRDRNGSRVHILGLPGGYLDACTVERDHPSNDSRRRGAVILATIRGGHDAYQRRRRVWAAYGWVLATHDVR